MVTIRIVVKTLREKHVRDKVKVISITAPSSASRSAKFLRKKSGKSVYTPEIDIPGIQYLPTIHLPPPLLCPGGSATVRVVKEKCNKNGVRVQVLKLRAMSTSQSIRLTETIPVETAATFRSRSITAASTVSLFSGRLVWSFTLRYGHVPLGFPIRENFANLAQSPVRRFRLDCGEPARPAPRWHFPPPQNVGQKCGRILTGFRYILSNLTAECMSSYGRKKHAMGIDQGRDEKRCGLTGAVIPGELRGRPKLSCSKFRIFVRQSSILPAWHLI